jgi:hypothetical protein
VTTAAGNSIYVCWSYWHNGLGGSGEDLLYLNSYTGSQVARLTHNSTGAISAFNRTNANVGTSGSSLLTASGWHRIEAKITLGTTVSTGAIEVRVDGTTVLTVSSIDINTSTLTLAGAIFSGAATQWYVDDIIMFDSTGSAPFNDYIGDVRIETLIPNGAGATQNWTANTGTQTDAVDDTPNAADDDTTYISSSTVSQKSCFDMSNLSNTPTAIHGVQLRPRMKKSDAGNRTARAYVRSSSSETNGTTLGLSTDYSWRRGGCVETDPATSSAWTGSGVDGAQLGVEVVS